MLTPTWRQSPNFDQRLVPVRYIVLHGTWMDDDEEALTRLCDPQAKVSCHYFIGKEGELYQLVKEKNIAWHAGVSEWGDIDGLNAHSIGIEISNPGEGKGVDYTQKQYEVLIALLKDLMARHDIHSEHILGHSDISPGRKTDPGFHFDWGVLEKHNLAAHLPKDLENDETALHQIGYRGDFEDVQQAYLRRVTFKPEKV
mgnify:CR=1 FL=1